jgi:hypothetical protein
MPAERRAMEASCTVKRMRWEKKPKGSRRFDHPEFLDNEGLSQSVSPPLSPPGKRCGLSSPDARGFFGESLSAVFFI